MATTTNYGWDTPDDTDLVKDGAAAIRTLGSSADTTLKNLNPETTLGDISYRSATSNTNTRLAIGTTGQVLTVAGGVPSWASPSDQTPLTTKGDLFTFSTSDARLAVGANGTVLTADSAETTGLKWATAGGSPTSWTLINAGGTALTGATTISVSGISGYKQLLMFVHDCSSVSASSNMLIRFNNVTTANYTTMGVNNTIQNTYTPSAFASTSNTYSGATIALNFNIGNDATASGQASVFIDSVDSTGWKRYISIGSGALFAGGSNGQTQQIAQGIFETNVAITEVSITSGTGNFDGGTLYVLGGA